METNQKPINEYVANLTSWHTEIIGNKVVAALIRNRFDAEFFANRDQLINKVLSHITPGSKVAFGGSQTIKQLGIPEAVIKAGAIVLDHNAVGLSSSEKLEIMRAQLTSDVFISSTNAVSLQGELFNIDGNGNRVAAMTFGPSKVIVIAGTNKICTNEDTAWERIRNLAAPVNYKRLQRPNPCVKRGSCMNCNLPTRGCNIYVALRKKPSLTDFSVFIVNETLGF